MATSVADLVTRLHANIDSIHSTIRDLSDTSAHDAALERLSELRETQLRDLESAHNAAIHALKTKRQGEAEDTAEKRRVEAEVLAKDRQREWDEIVARRQREDEERKRKLEEEERENERLRNEEDIGHEKERRNKETGIKDHIEREMERLEEEMERRIEEGKKALQDLDNNRKAINKQIEEALNAPSVIPKIQFRSRAKAVQKQAGAHDAEEVPENAADRPSSRSILVMRNDEDNSCSSADGQRMITPNIESTNLVQATTDPSGDMDMRNLVAVVSNENSHSHVASESSDVTTSTSTEHSPEEATELDGRTKRSSSDDLAIAGTRPRTSSGGKELDELMNDSDALAADSTASGDRRPLPSNPAELKRDKIEVWQADDNVDLPDGEEEQHEGVGSDSNRAFKKSLMSRFFRRPETRPPPLRQVEQVPKVASSSIATSPLAPNTLSVGKSEMKQSDNVSAPYDTEVPASTAEQLVSPRDAIIAIPSEQWIMVSQNTSHSQNAAIVSPSSSMSDESDDEDNVSDSSDQQTHVETAAKPEEIPLPDPTPSGETSLQLSSAIVPADPAQRLQQDFLVQDQSSLRKLEEEASYHPMLRNVDAAGHGTSEDSLGSGLGSHERRPREAEVQARSSEEEEPSGDNSLEQALASSPNTEGRMVIGPLTHEMTPAPMADLQGTENMFHYNVSPHQETPLSPQPELRSFERNLTSKAHNEIDALKPRDSEDQASVQSQINKVQIHRPNFRSRPQFRRRITRDLAVMTGYGSSGSGSEPQSDDEGQVAVVSKTSAPHPGDQVDGGDNAEGSSGSSKVKVQQGMASPSEPEDGPYDEKSKTESVDPIPIGPASGLTDSSASVQRNLAAGSRAGDRSENALHLENTSRPQTNDVRLPPKASVTEESEQDESRIDSGSPSPSGNSLSTIEHNRRASSGQMKEEQSQDSDPLHTDTKKLDSPLEFDAASDDEEHNGMVQQEERIPAPNSVHGAAAHELKHAEVGPDPAHHQPDDSQVDEPHNQSDIPGPEQHQVALEEGFEEDAELPVTGAASDHLFDSDEDSHYDDDDEDDDGQRTPQHNIHNDPFSTTTELPRTPPLLEDMNASQTPSDASPLQSRWAHIRKLAAERAASNQGSEQAAGYEKIPNDPVSENWAQRRKMAANLASASRMSNQSQSPKSEKRESSVDNDTEEFQTPSENPYTTSEGTTPFFDSYDQQYTEPTGYRSRATTGGSVPPYLHSVGHSTTSSPSETPSSPFQDSPGEEPAISTSWDSPGRSVDPRTQTREVKPDSGDFDPYNPQSYPSYMSPKAANVNEEAKSREDTKVVSEGEPASLQDKTKGLIPLKTQLSTQRPRQSDSSVSSSRTGSRSATPTAVDSPTRLPRRMTAGSRSSTTSPINPPTTSFFQKTRQLFDAPPSAHQTVHARRSSATRPVSGLYQSSSPLPLRSAAARGPISPYDEMRDGEVIPKSLDEDGKAPSPVYSMPSATQVPPSSSRRRSSAERGSMLGGFGKWVGATSGGIEDSVYNPNRRTTEGQPLLR